MSNEFWAAILGAIVGGAVAGGVGLLLQQREWAHQNALRAVETRRQDDLRAAEVQRQADLRQQDVDQRLQERRFEAVRRVHMTAVEMARSFESKGIPWCWDAKEEALVAIAELRLYRLSPVLEKLVSNLEGRVNEFSSQPFPIDLLRTAERELTTAARKEVSGATDPTSPPDRD